MLCCTAAAVVHDTITRDNGGRSQSSGANYAVRTNILSNCNSPSQIPLSFSLLCFIRTTPLLLIISVHKRLLSRSHCHLFALVEITSTKIILAPCLNQNNIPAPLMYLRLDTPGKQCFCSTDLVPFASLLACFTNNDHPFNTNVSFNNAHTHSYRTIKYNNNI